MFGGGRGRWGCTDIEEHHCEEQRGNELKEKSARELHWWLARRNHLLGNMGDRSGGGGRGEQTDIEEHHSGRGETTMEGRDKCQDH